MEEEVRVLHVEDEPEFAEVAADLLEREDPRFEVRSAVDTDEALDLLREEEFDCVVSDYEMPKRDGIQLLEETRERAPEVPFILFTGKGSEEIASEAISAGVTDYLQKESGTSQYEVLANRIANAVEQHRARREVEETERKLSEIAEKTDDVLFMFDGDWSEVLFVNSAYEEIWGGSIEEVEEDARAFLDLVHPDDREEVLESMDRISEGEPDSLEYRVVRPDGDLRWVHADSKPIFDGDGEVERIVGYVRDVTEQRERRRRYEAVFDQTYQFTGLLEADGTLLEANETALKFGGLDHEDVVGEKIWDTYWFQVSEETRSRVRESVDQALEDGFVRGELEVQGEEETAVIDYSLQSVEQEAAEDPLLVAEGREITERVEREEELEKRTEELERKNRFLEAISRYTPLPMFMKGSDGEYIWVNDEWLRLFDLDEEDVLGRTGRELHPEEMNSEVSDNDRRVLESGEVIEVEEEIPTADGHRTFLSSKAPVYFEGEDDEADAVFGVATDITEREERRRELEEMNQRLEEFASVVSHDLRNPLSVARGRLELAREDPGGGHLEAAERSLARMERIIDDMLWLAREGRSIGEKGEVDMSDVVDRAWEQVGTGEAELDVGFDDARVQGDDDRLIQMFENVFRNAVEHAGDDVEVEVGWTGDGFYVADDGPGVPEDRRGDVFDAGYSTTDDGTGFGLSIVRRIAEAHGWEVELGESGSGGAKLKFHDVDYV